MLISAALISKVLISAALINTCTAKATTRAAGFHACLHPHDLWRLPNGLAMLAGTQQSGVGILELLKAFDSALLQTPSCVLKRLSTATKCRLHTIGGSVLLCQAVACYASGFADVSLLHASCHGPRSHASYVEVSSIF
jgi:hypothetical protein